MPPDDWRLIDQRRLVADIQALYRRGQRRRGRKAIVAGATAAVVVVAVAGITLQQTRPPTVILDSPRAPLTVESAVQALRGSQCP